MYDSHAFFVYILKLKITNQPRKGVEARVIVLRQGMNSDILTLTIGDKNQTTKKNVFSDFSLPQLLAPMKQERQSRFFDGLLAIPSVSKLISDLTKDGFTIVIPSELREAIKNGKFHFGKSKQSLTGVAPNIYDKLGKLRGQVYMERTKDYSNLLNDISSLAMMIMLQSLSEKLDAIFQKIDIIHTAQKNDRLGCIIGSFKAFVVSRSVFCSEEERRKAAFLTFSKMNEGMCQIHFELNDSWERISKFPHDNNDFIKKSFTKLWDSTDYEEEYNAFVKDLYDYYNMLVLSDALLLDLGASSEELSSNHQPLNAFLDRTMTGDFIKVAEFVKDGQPKELTDFLKESRKLLIDFNLQTEHKSVGEVKFVK